MEETLMVNSGKSSENIFEHAMFVKEREDARNIFHYLLPPVNLSVLTQFDSW
jgi:hypothetical protein